MSVKYLKGCVREPLGMISPFNVPIPEMSSSSNSNAATPFAYDRTTSPWRFWCYRSNPLISDDWRTRKCERPMKKHDMGVTPSNEIFHHHGKGFIAVWYSDHGDIL